MNYVKAIVRLEGGINREWTLLKEDGTGEVFYSIEGSPQYADNDKRVFDYDEELGTLLERVSDLFPVEEDETIEYEVDLLTQKVKLRFKKREEYV